MAKNEMSTVDWIAYILLIVGGLNWGLEALDINLVTLIFGAIPILVTIVYLLVGISALYVAFKIFKK